MKRRRYFLTGGLLAVHLLMATELFLASAHSSGWWRLRNGICWFGWTAGQVAVLATWVGMAQMRDVVLRIPWALLFLVLLWLLLVGILRREDALFLNGLATASAIVALVAVFVAGALLKFGSWLTRWTLELEDSDEAGTGQFRIWHLLALTTVAAFVIACAQFVLPGDGWDHLLRPNASTVALLAMFAGYTSLFTLIDTVLIIPVCLWGSSRIALANAWIFPFAWLGYAAIATAVETGILVSIPHDGSIDGEWVAYLWLFNVAQGLCLFGSLLVMRLAGWRLVRGGKRGAESLVKDNEE